MDTSRLSREHESDTGKAIFKGAFAIIDASDNRNGFKIKHPG